MYYDNMVKYTCEYCNSSFTTKYVLARHQNQASYCLQKRKVERTDYNCTCGKKYSRMDVLKRHQKQCSKAKKTIDQVPTKEHNSEELLLKVIDKYGDMVKDLQRQISELSSRPTTITNNNNNTNVLNNLQPITDEDLQEHLVNLTLDFIQEGAKGYANFAGNYPFKDKVLCTDRSRKRLRYKDADGILTDNGRVLAQRFFQAISERNTEILNRAYSDLHRDLQDIVAEGRAGESDVTGILTQATKLQDILIKSQRVAQGEDDEFAEEFLSHLTKIL